MSNYVAVNEGSLRINSPSARQNISHCTRWSFSYLSSMQRAQTLTLIIIIIIMLMVSRERKVTVRHKLIQNKTLERLLMKVGSQTTTRTTTSCFQSMARTDELRSSVVQKNEPYQSVRDTQETPAENNTHTFIILLIQTQ